MANTNLMSSREACEALGIKRSTLTYWMLTGRISPAQTIPGPNRAASHLFSADDVERLSAQRTPETPGGGVGKPAAGPPSKSCGGPMSIGPILLMLACAFTLAGAIAVYERILARLRAELDLTIDALTEQARAAAKDRHPSSAQYGGGNLRLVK